MFVLFFLVLSIFFNKVTSDATSRCESKKNCGDCIAYPYETCVWCSESDMEGPRCSSINVSNQFCNGLAYTKDDLETYKPLKNDSIGGLVNGGTTVVQLTPQHVLITARPGKQVYFNISYKPAKNRELDIYYLIDNSYSMLAHKEELILNGEKILTVLSEMSNNIKLGIGTFVDKPALPYAKKHNKAYSFKHHLSFTSDMNLFKNTVELLPNDSSNLDDPEGGFDALMQAMVCEDEIGWRPNAWRVIVFCTDDPYHSAGDGKMVGAFHKYNMTCQLENKMYTGALKYDYPSVGQINDVVINKKFNIIFAATQSVSNVYKALEETIQWSRYAELKDKSNIVKIIEEEYKKLSQNLHLNTNVPDGMQLTINPACDQKIPDCSISYNSTKHLTVSVTISSCIDYTAEINAIGVNDILKIDIKPICSCPCEREGIENSIICMSNGKLECGICKCNENRYGEKCECDKSSATSNDVQKCKAQNDTETCTDRGTCGCDGCYCNMGFSGPFCEYDDNACVTYQGQMCANHGTCNLGGCICDHNWSGADCSCPNHHTDCIGPDSEEICSGNGYCNCGTCICNRNTNKIYYGDYCNDCEECQEKICDKHNKIVKQYCKLESEITCRENITEVEIEIFDEDEFSYVKGTHCVYAVDEYTDVLYKYIYSREKLLKLNIQRKIEYRPKANIWIPIGASIGSIILVGLLTALLWKIIITRLDAAEYEKFLKATEAEGYDVTNNPLYESPAINFVNPSFESND